MDWYSLHLQTTNPAVKEYLTTCAFDLGCTGVEDMDESYFFDAMEGREHGLKIFFAGDKDPEEMIRSLKAAILLMPDEDTDPNAEITIEEIAKQNWREEWKKDYKPIDAKDFVVVPAWLDADFGGKIKILIEPKMAFGTGTHETTRMMLDLLSDIDCQGKKVLDAGTGSGILAIATAKKGALEITGNDVEQESIDNSLENWELNNLDSKLAEFGLADCNSYTKENYYDLVLANIHRAVLEVLIDDLHKVTQNGGMILLSGILNEERQIMLDKIATISGLTVDKVIEFNEWCSLKLIKNK